MLDANKLTILHFTHNSPVERHNSIRPNQIPQLEIKDACHININTYIFLFGIIQGSR